MPVFFYVLSFIKDREFKRYVGQTNNIKKRIHRHLKSLTNGKHHNQKLQKAFDEGWKFTGLPLILEMPTREEAYRLEQEYIWGNRENPEFVNIECGNDTFSKNPRKKEIRIKLTNHLKNWWENLSDEERHVQHQKLFGESNGMFGRNHTEETKRVIREKANIRQELYGSPIKGIPKSVEHRAKISKVASERLGIKNPFFGKHHTEDVKQRLSEKSKGRIPPNIRKVSILGVVYVSLTEAGRQLGVHTTVVLHRVKSDNPKFSDWKWF